MGHLKFPQSVRSGDLTLKHLLKKTTTHSGYPHTATLPRGPTSLFLCLNVDLTYHRHHL